MSTRATRQGGKGRDEFLELVTAFAPRSIRDEAQYDTTLAVVQRYMLRDEESLTDAEQDYLELLVTVVERYEREHVWPDFKLNEITPVQILRRLMEANDMAQADLASILGGKSRASEVLSGKRSLSKAQIRALADRFKVDAGLFL